MTYDHAAILDEPLWPRCGLMTRAEVGLRGERFWLSGSCEVMSWLQSSVVQGAVQPDSQLFTVGGNLGFRF